MTTLKEWTTEAGFHGLILEHRNLGHLTGYVGVPCEHPMYDFGYSECMERCGSDSCSWGKGHPSPDQFLNAHGGITFAGRDLTNMRETLWYFGFDCAHAGDYVPKGIYHHPGEVYRDEAYVTKEIESLLEQLQNFVWVRELPEGVK